MTPSNEGPASRPTLLQLIWGSYLRSALAPVLLIELALIAAYLITNGIMRDQNIATMKQLATEQLRDTAQQQSALIGHQLAAVAQSADLLRRQTEHAFVTPFVPDDAESLRYTWSKDGALYTAHDLPGRAAFIYSGRAHIGKEERAKALQLSQLDPLLVSLVETHPLVVQAYFTTRDYMTRLYPYTDILSLLPTDIDATTYNFYYEADEKHNPQRQVVWTDVYIDPVGKGWIASAIAPVYPRNSTRLEAVVGLDITIGTFIDQVLALHLPWSGYGVLVDKQGTIFALPAQGERDWGLKELTQYSYHDTIKRDTFKPDSFNLLKREDSRELGAKLAAVPQGMSTVTLAGHRKQVAWSTVSGTGWKLLLIVDEADIFAQAYALNARFNRVGLGMFVALVLFYVLFFAWLYRRVRRMSALLIEPLMDLEDMMQRIAQGQYAQPMPSYPVIELQRTGQGLVHMGQFLGQSNRALEDARKSLEQLNHELEERILLRTHELEKVNDALQHENAARQALIQKLQRMQDQLVQAGKLSALGQLTAGIAHELKNPLNIINNFAELNIEFSDELLEAMRDQPETRLSKFQATVESLKHNASTINQHGKRANRIIQSMMEHARGGSVNFQQINVNALVEEYIQLTCFSDRARSPESQVTIVRRFEPSVGEVLASPQEIGRVIQNLLHNALYAVTVKQRGSEDTYTPSITVRTSETGDVVVIQVEDNGIGIPTEIRDRIFEPFFTTKPPGASNTGLGLSLSHDIVVKVHQGSLSVESELGVGSTFTVKLPRRQAHKGVVGTLAE